MCKAVELKALYLKPWSIQANRKAVHRVSQAGVYDLDSTETREQGAGVQGGAGSADWEKVGNSEGIWWTGRGRQGQRGSET